MTADNPRFKDRIEPESAVPDAPKPAPKPKAPPKSVQGRPVVPPRPRQIPKPPAGHILIGQVVGSFGLKGWLKVQPMTDFYERFEPDQTVFIGPDTYTVVDAELHRSQLRLKVKGITHIDDAEALRWQPVSVPESERPEMEEDEFYTADLLGCEVVRTDGTVLGKLDEVVPSPAQDLIRVGEIFIPFIKEFVKEVDLEKRLIKVELIPGFLPDEPGEEAR